MILLVKSKQLLLLSQNCVYLAKYVLKNKPEGPEYQKRNLDEIYPF